MSYFDVCLRQIEGEGNGFHFRIDENGDVERDDTFHSAINVSLFTDRRADKSEVPQPQRRRGWEGDEFLELTDYLIGSKLWLLEQARNTIATRNKAVEIVRNALDWFIQKGYCDRIDVVGRRILPSTLEITSTFFVEDNIINSFTFDVWQKTKATPQRKPLVPKNLFSAMLSDLNFNGQFFSYPGGVTSGQEIISIEMWVSITNTGTPSRTFYQETQTTSTLDRFALEMTNIGQLEIKFRNSDNGTLITTMASQNLFINRNYHVLAVVNSQTNVMEIYLDGQLLHRDTSQTFGPIMSGDYFTDSRIGSSNNTPVENILGNIGFIGIYNTDKSSQIKRLYNNGDAICYSSRPSSLRAGGLFFSELANWVGHEGNETFEHVGNKTITNNGSVGYIGTCLRVECNDQNIPSPFEFIDGDSFEFIDSEPFEFIGE